MSRGTPLGLTVKVLDVTWHQMLGIATTNNVKSQVSIKVGSFCCHFFTSLTYLCLVGTSTKITAFLSICFYERGHLLKVRKWTKMFVCTKWGTCGYCSINTASFFKWWWIYVGLQHNNSKTELIPCWPWHNMNCTPKCTGQCHCPVLCTTSYATPIVYIITKDLVNDKGFVEELKMPSSKSHPWCHNRYT